MTTAQTEPRTGVTPKTGQVSFRPIGSIRPSPENEKLYRPIGCDAEIESLACSIMDHGLREPIRVTLDGYILSGHRRYAACQLAGLEQVPCVVESILRSDPKFMALLREFNRQRVKSLDEVIREQVIDASEADPEEAFGALQQHREVKAKVDLGACITIRKKTTRAEITRAKQPFLDAIRRIIELQKAYWPLSDRSIHYDLLNDPPLKHASKPGSRYANDKESYKNLTNLLTRARLVGLIPFRAIADETRTVKTWSTHRSIGPFIASDLDDFLRGYWRDLQQSQPSQIEVVAEKNTLANTIEPLCRQYTIPYTIGRGYSSIPPRYEMAQRFKASGKQQLIILIMSDFDGAGEEIAHSFARSMRDDFGIENLVAKKVCLTYEQAIERDLPRSYLNDKKGMIHERHMKKYRNRTHEVEALPVAERRQLLEEAILSSMDIEAYNVETAAERADAAKLEAMRKAALPLIWKAAEGTI